MCQELILLMKIPFLKGHLYSRLGNWTNPFIRSVGSFLNGKKLSNPNLLLCDP